MGRCVIVAYKPKPGCAPALLAAVSKHLQVLSAEGLLTSRPGLAMRGADGTIIEIFEWLSQDAMGRAHSNPAVGALWAEFAAACDYVPLSSLPEAHNMFAEFDSVAL